MRPFILAVALLVIPSVATACNPVQAIVAPQAFYAPQAIVAQPIVYQAQVLAQPVVFASFYATPIVQQVVVRQRIVNRRHPVRNLVRVPFSMSLRIGGCH